MYIVNNEGVKRLIPVFRMCEVDHSVHYMVTRYQWTGTRHWSQVPGQCLWYISIFTFITFQCQKVNKTNFRRAQHSSTPTVISTGAIQTCYHANICSDGIQTPCVNSSTFSYSCSFSSPNILMRNIFYENMRTRSVNLRQLICWQFAPQNVTYGFSGWQNHPVIG